MFSSRNFRDALSRYPTGVTLVTAFHEGRALGVTVNSFASVSLDPPLILWSAAKDTERCRIFTAAEHFAVNILAADQRDLAEACAGEPDLQSLGARWLGSATPLIDGAIAQLVCRRWAVHPGGDHEIILGEVTAIHEPRRAAALTFHEGGYGASGSA